MAEGNGITVTKSHVSFWGSVIVALCAICGTYFGSSRPAVAPESKERGEQILANQITLTNLVLQLQSDVNALTKEVKEIKKKDIK